MGAISRLSLPPPSLRFSPLGPGGGGGGNEQKGGDEKEEEEKEGVCVLQNTRGDETYGKKLSERANTGFYKQIGPGEDSAFEN